MSSLAVLRVECPGTGVACIDGDCPICHGDRTVWSDEVVEAVARAIATEEERQMRRAFGDAQWARWWGERDQPGSWGEEKAELARAALDAMREKLMEVGDG